jgi:hypothetical protein
MPHRLLTNLFEWKMIGGSAVALLATATDGLASPTGWESLGLKTGLVLAIIYLVNELNKQRAKAAEEAVKREAQFATEAAKREERFAAVIEANTKAKEENTQMMSELKASTDTQTSYYKTVAQTLLSREHKPKLPQ